MDKIRLSIPTYGNEEIMEIMDSLLSTNVTMGKKCEAFEHEFSIYQKIRYSHLVTSGSDANLLALSTLSNPTLDNYIREGDEIITPAVTFATTVYPIYNIRAIPVFVDIDLKNLGITPKLIEEAITEKTKAIMPVHLLGVPCDIISIKKIANRHNLLLIEDCCDSVGAEVDGKKVGTYGDIGTFSFFFTHIISTIEGGMVSTNNKEYSTLLRSLKSYGWIRDYPNKNEISKQYDIDPRFLFLHAGYNMKPTEIQGAFGIHQLKKLDYFVECRRKNADRFVKCLKQYPEYFHIIEEEKNTKAVWYGYPIIVKDNKKFIANDLSSFLNKNEIETRPILSGDFTKQPAIQNIKHRIGGLLTNSNIIQHNSFFIGNHHGITEEEREYICGCIDKFIKGL